MAFAKFFFISLIFIALLGFPAKHANANWLEEIGVPGGQIVPKGCSDFKPNTGGDAEAVKAQLNEQCGLNKVYVTIANISQVILALAGSGAMLMITIGGVLWIIAAGNQDRINQGKQAIIAAAIGLAIVLTAWLVVNTIIWALSKGEVGRGPATIFGQQFNRELNQ